MIQNIGLLHNELISCGLSISGCDSSGNVHFLEPDTNNIAPLVLAAHEQPLSSDECLALQAAITEAQWLAYQDARKAPIRAQRAERYRQEADPMRLKMDEDYTPNSAEWETARLAWIAVKNSIRTELPYPS